MKKSENIFTNTNFKVLSIVFCIVSLILVIINNFNITPYVGKFIIPITFIILTYICVIKKFELESKKDAYYLLIPVLLMLFSYFIVDLPESNIILNVLIVPIVTSIFLYSLINENYKISKSFISDFFILFPNRLISNLDYLKLLKKKNKGSKSFDNLVIGLSIGIPIAIILLLLLGSADAYFGTLISNIFDFIKRVLSIGNLIPNVIMFLIFFIVMFSVFVNLLRNRNNRVINKEPKSINISIGKIVLTIVNSVFCLFLLSEISRLTTNFLQLPVEYTYANYAREGFFQLLFVTLINISIIIYFVYFTTSSRSNKTIKKLIALLISFSILLIINSYYRMFLYIGAYGFTILRLQVILFLLMELIVFVLILMYVLCETGKKQSITYYLIFVITYIINLYMCNQGIVDMLNNLFKFNPNI